MAEHEQCCAEPCCVAKRDHEDAWRMLLELQRVIRPQRIDSYPMRWSKEQKDAWRAATRRDYPNIRFAPSTEQMATLFGHRSQREES